jgi:hypothetical protein
MYDKTINYVSVKLSKEIPLVNSVDNTILYQKVVQNDAILKCTNALSLGNVYLFPKGLFEFHCFKRQYFELFQLNI